MPEAPTDLFVLPYFEPSGSPDFVTECTGSIHGLRLDTQRGDILKAVMESVTFYFAQHIGSLTKVGIDTSQFVATGGGAKSNKWLQIKSDILGVPFIRPKSTECGIAGAAILAGAASGDFDSFEDGINCLVTYEQTFEPDRDRSSIYRERLEEYSLLSEKYLS
jgi:xylulokinase